MKTQHDDQQLLEHFRQNQQQAPSAELDASILAAASAEVRKPSIGARLHSWFFAGGHGRWSVALGSLAVVGIAVGLVFNGYRPSSPAYDNPAPAMQRYAAPAQALSSAPQADSVPLLRKSMPAKEAAGEEMVEPAIAPRAAEEALTQSPSSVQAEADELQRQLQLILRLRKDGHTQQAEALTKDLQVQYPRLDIDHELQALGTQGK